MKKISCLFKSAALRVMIAVFVASLLTTSLNVARVAAISYTGVATPSSTAYGVNFIAFEVDVPPTGDWTSTTTSLDEGRAAAYLMPELSGTCDEAELTSLVVTVEETSIDLAPGTTQELAGVMMGVVGPITDFPSPFLPLNSVISGGTWISNGRMGVRGITHHLFTDSPQLIPGSISIEIDTTGLTVADYKNMAVSVHHDLRDGVLGFVNSVTTSQPIVEVQTSEAACYPLRATDDAGSTKSRQSLEVAASGGLLVNDEGLAIQVTGYTQPAGGSVTVQPDGSYVYTPNKGFSGEDSFTYTITDQFGRTRTATVRIVVAEQPGTLAETGADNVQTASLLAVVILAATIGLVLQTKRRPVRYRHR